MADLPRFSCIEPQVYVRVHDVADVHRVPVIQTEVGPRADVVAPLADCEISEGELHHVSLLHGDGPHAVRVPWVLLGKSRGVKAALTAGHHLCGAFCGTHNNAVHRRSRFTNGRQEKKLEINIPIKDTLLN